MSALASVLHILWRVALVFLVVSYIFYLGVWYGHRHPRVAIPPQPTRCAFCGGSLRSEFVWSSVCRARNRGQVGPFATDNRTGWKEAEAPPFVSHVDVGARHASDSPGGYPWKGL